MIIVHETFIAKPGSASKLAKLFKESMSGMREVVNILTDVTGTFNKVVIVTKYESLSEYEANFEKYMQNSEELKKMMEAMKGYHDLYQSGSREIYRTW